MRKAKRRGDDPLWHARDVFRVVEKWRMLGEAAVAHKVEQELNLPEEIRVRALRPIQRMLELS